MTRARDNSFNPFNNQAAGKNYFINGAMDFWQRGTSFTTPGGAYTADRYKVTVNGAGTYVVSRQAAGLDGFQYCLRFQRSSGQTYTSGSFIGYAWAPEDAVLMQGKPVTYSFYARRGADYSSSSPSSGISVQLQQGTGNGTHAFSGLTNETNVLTGNATLTSSWQRFSFTGIVSANTTELRTNIAHSPSGTAGANDWYEITGLQLEIGSTATAFSRSGGTIGGELLLCQRYYEKNYIDSVVPGSNINPASFGMIEQQALFLTTASGATPGTARSRSFPYQFKVQKRTSPSVRIWDLAGNANRYTSGDSNGAFSSNNNSFDVFGGTQVTQNSITWQTTMASSGHIYAGIMWEASAEL
jgi:hypothetical protein